MTPSRTCVRFVTVLAIVCMLGGPVAVRAGNGRKQFREGLDNEQAERWERASEQFALALAEDPSNTEYKLHYLRSVSSASIMFTQQGDKFFEQKDYNAAYQAYRKAYSYDPTNELSGAKMKYSMKLLGMEPEKESNPNDIVRARYERDDASIVVPKSRKVYTDVIYHNSSLRQVIDSLAESLGLNVIYDKDFKDEKNIDFEVRNVTKAKALEMLLFTNKYFYVQADSRTLIIAPDQPPNRARYQNLAVKTFMIRNADVGEVRTLIQQIVATKYLVANKQQNSLTVRDTPANLELIQTVIDSIDKDRAEVLIDVNLYEVDHSDLLQLGNQFNVATSGAASTGSLATFFGGVGQADALRSVTPAGFYGPIGLALSLPTSTLTAFQSKGKTRLLNAAQVHVLDNEQHTIRIGQRVPIQTASYVGTSTTVVTGNGGGNNQNNQNQNVSTLGGPATQYQYENVGLNIDMQPVVREDMVQIKMKLETSDVAEGAGIGGNPIFTQRQMSSVASIKNGQTTLIAGVSSVTRSDSVQGLPLISLLPGIGRLFATPKNQKKVVDLVITVTPHIIRSPVYREEDNRAIPAGSSTAPDRQISIEEIVYRAELEEAGGATPPIASAPPAATPARAAAPPGPRSHVTEVDMNLPIGAPAATRQVSASPGEVISTPGGRAAAPVVAPEDATPKPKPPPSAPPKAPTVQATPPADDDEDDDDDDDDSEPNANKASSSVEMRLTAMQTASVGKPAPVAVFGNGLTAVTSAVVAVTFDPKLMRVSRVESTGLFDGQLGAKLPFDVRDGVVYITMGRAGDASKQPASGQMFNIWFDVIGSGAATLSIVPTASRLTGAGNAVAELRTSGAVTVTTR